MKITIEFKNIDEYLEFKEKNSAQEDALQERHEFIPEDSINGKHYCIGVSRGNAY